MLKVKNAKKHSLLLNCNTDGGYFILSLPYIRYSIDSVIYEALCMFSRLVLDMYHELGARRHGI